MSRTEQGGIPPLIPVWGAATVLCWDSDLVDVPEPDPLDSGRSRNGHAGLERDFEQLTHLVVTAVVGGLLDHQTGWPDGQRRSLVAARPPREAADNLLLCG